MATSSEMTTFIIKQHKEWGEALTGFEGANKYSIMDPDGEVAYTAQEVGGSMLGRTFMRSKRPFTIEVRSTDRQMLLKIERPFRFIFSEITIYNCAGDILGSVKQKYGFGKIYYTAYNARLEELLTIDWSIFKPWTFPICLKGKEVGKIAKKWSGAIQEMLTDADTFALAFEESLEANVKSILLGTVFLIDFLHFESNNKRS